MLRRKNIDFLVISSLRYSSRGGIVITESFLDIIFLLT